jgi:hypothetical protein
MQTTRSNIRCLWIMFFVLVPALAWMLSFGNVATADYSSSAHGDSSDGVNRSGVDEPTGDCAHCHDFGSSCGEYQFMLFYDDAKGVCDLFCFTCHSDSLTWQPVANYPYCVTFGGASPHNDTIYTQLCDADSMPSQCGSRHNMGQIRAGLLSAVGQAWGFNSDPDPCVACHNPHADQRNHPAAIVGGKLNTAIRRPSHYDNTALTDFLWGDDAGERMSDYAAQFVNGNYQAPYYADTTSGRYEPNGSTDEPAGGWGSDTPDYVTFCLDCHQYTLYDPDRGGAAVKPIDWTAERHGSYPSNDCTNMGFVEGSLTAPYIDSSDSNYVLSCLDCHEPHGTKQRLHLIRRMINGQLVDADTGPCDQHTDWAQICEKCHAFTNDHLSWGGCQGCHGNFTGFHGTTFPFGSGLDNCLDKPSF